MFILKKWLETFRHKKDAKKLGSGLQPLPYDHRDFSFGIFGDLFDYQPKSQEHSIQTLSVKRQKYNTCSWTASAAGKEIDEKIPLSMRSLVCLGKKEGYINGDGFANLRSNESILQKYGAAEESVFSSYENEYLDWENYSNAGFLEPIMIENAAKHKTQSFWKVNTKNEIYKNLDNDRPVKVGLDWFTGYNMAGGLADPWILDKNKGSYVGGHAVLCVSYNQNYYGNRVFRCQNSYGKEYGLNGDFFIKEEHLMENIYKYGAFCNLDIAVDTAKWLIENKDKIVKSADNPNVYLIQDGRKRLFKDLATLYAFDYADAEITVDNEGILDQIELGEPLDFWQGGNVKGIKTIIQQRKELKSIFNNYFQELFSL